MNDAVAIGVPAADLHAEITKLGVTHVVVVPDTHQRTFLQRLYDDPAIRVVSVATEDEAIGVNAGLWLGGANPIVVIQQLGLFASVNALRGIALDMNIPTFICAGMYGRDVSRTVAANSQRSVRLIEPMLDSLGVANELVEGPGDIGAIARGYARSREISGPAVVLIGAPTT